MAPAADAQKLSKRPIRFRALDRAKVFPPGLAETCLKKLGTNFLDYDTPMLLKKLKPTQLKTLYDNLDLNMDIVEAATRISDEDYWKRRMLTTRANCQVRDYGMSWKQAFLESDLARRLETLEVPPTADSVEALRKQVVASSAHIFQLKLSTLPSHVDISFLFDNCPALCSIEITYGHKRLGMDYERAEFGMKISDSQILARNFCVSQTLVSVALQCNMIDDELVKILVHGLQHAHMVTHLDLAHNKICDRGARRLASLLDPEYALHSLVLADNQIHANGCMHLGAHLADNLTLEHLDLRLNRCEDNGVSHLFHDLCVNKYLKTLNLACNDLTQRSLPYLSSMLNDNRRLEELDISANPLYVVPISDEGGEQAEEAVEPQASGVPLQLPGLEHLSIDRDTPVGIMIMCVNSNPTITKLDIRRCSFPPEIEEVLTTMVKHKELRKRKIPVEAYERKRAPEATEETAEAAEAGEQGEETAEAALVEEGEKEDEDAEDGEGGEV